MQKMYTKKSKKHIQKMQKFWKNHTKNAKNDISVLTGIWPGLWLSPALFFGCSLKFLLLAVCISALQKQTGRNVSDRILMDCTGFEENPIRNVAKKVIECSVSAKCSTSVKCHGRRGDRRSPNLLPENCGIQANTRENHQDTDRICFLNLSTWFLIKSLAMRWQWMCLTVGMEEVWAPLALNVTVVKCDNLIWLL
jgi:hypothetical protein